MQRINNGVKATAHDIAKIIGITRSTVYMALRNDPKIAEKTRFKVQAVAKQLNFEPDPVARALVTNKTNTLGVITSSDVANVSFSKIFIGIQEVIYKHNFSVLFYSTYISQEKKIAAIKKLIAKKVDGLILLPNPEDIEDIKYLGETNVPFVLVGRHFLDIQLDNQTDYVISDHEKGAYELTKHIIKVGHKRIAYVGFPLNISTSQERVNGYKKALIENGIDIKEELIFLTPKQEIDQNLPKIISSILALKEIPTAIFVVDDDEAVKLIKLLKEKGLRIPGDIAVVGYDNIDYAEYFDPPLTTVDQLGNAIGRKTAELLLDKIAGKYKDEVQHIVIDPKLVVRKSCGAELKKSNQ